MPSIVGSKFGKQIDYSEMTQTDLAVSGSVYIHPTAWSSVASGSFAFGSGSTTDLGGGIIDNGGGCAVNDEVQYEVYLGVGTYTVRLYYRQGTANGQLDLEIEGTKEGSTLDTYNAANASNQSNDWSSISVTSAGLKTIAFKVTGKNGASTSYRMMLHGIEVIRTA